MKVFPYQPCVTWGCKGLGRFHVGGVRGPLWLCRVCYDAYRERIQKRETA